MLGGLGRQRGGSQGPGEKLPFPRTCLRALDTAEIEIYRFLNVRVQCKLRCFLHKDNMFSNPEKASKKTGKRASW